MPYARRYSKRPAYPRKRYGKKYGRKRWSNKKFTKFNNKTRLGVRGLIMPKSAFVKLPFRELISSGSISPASSVGLLWVPTGYIPRPSDFTTSATRVDAQAGDVFSNGITQYAQYFKTGYVLGSSIKLQILPQGSATGIGISNQVQCTLVAYPYNAPPGGQAGTGIRTVFDELEALSDTNLQSLAYSKTRLVTLPVAKGEIFMNMFRKTKYMCGVKDIADNDDMEINIPQSATDFSTGDYAADQGFIYYLRVSNLAASTNSQACLVNAKLTQYWKLTERAPVLQSVATNPV